MYTAPPIESERLKSAVVAAMGSSSSCRSTYRRPSLASSRILADPPRSRTIGGSTLRIRDTNTTEPMNDSVSSTMAPGAWTRWISSPATIGPAIWAPERVSSMREFPSSSRDRSTSEGRYAAQAMSKRTVRTPVPNATR